MFKVNFVMCFVLTIVSSDNSVDGPTEDPIAKNDGETDAIRVNLTNGTIVSELQHTICSVKTEDVVASAQSTVSRIFTGVCTSEELTRAFKSMEKTFLEHLEKMQRNLVDFIETKFRHPVPEKKTIKNSKSSPFITVDYLFERNIFKNYT
ncbi:uncharacterized protein LOC111643982 [Copidosoma floridanum]|uniref:uncharacterized protein LOC111643982 n=1 Tax=Copidosoma floridanum TaxID=29053 RepID=UPI000C6F4FC6|nr:uncharacterized protein LOC111643982 [Copidosoma floridanum]